MVRTNNDDGAIFEGPIQKYPTDGFVELDIEPGSLVLIHGSVVHKSGPNIGGPPRNAYTFHVIEGSYEYDKRNWLQPSLGKDAFDAIY